MQLEEALRLATELAAPYDEIVHLGRAHPPPLPGRRPGCSAQRQEQLTQHLASVKLAKECQLYAYLAAAIKAHYAGGTQEAHRYAEQADQVNNHGGDILFRLVDTALILRPAPQWGNGSRRRRLSNKHLPPSNNSTGRYWLRKPGPDWHKLRWPRAI